MTKGGNDMVPAGLVMRRTVPPSPIALPSACTAERAPSMRAADAASATASLLTVATSMLHSPSFKVRRDSVLGSCMPAQGADHTLAFLEQHRVVVGARPRHRLEIDLVDDPAPRPLAHHQDAICEE